MGKLRTYPLCLVLLFVVLQCVCGKVVHYSPTHACTSVAGIPISQFILIFFFLFFFQYFIYNVVPEKLFIIFSYACFSVAGIPPFLISHLLSSFFYISFYIYLQCVCVHYSPTPLVLLLQVFLFFIYSLLNMFIKYLFILSFLYFMYFTSLLYM